MTAKIIDGKIIAADLRAAVKAEVQRLRTAHGIVPGLAVVLIGDEPASQSYVASKSRAVAEVGMRPFDHHLPADIDEAALLALVQKLNAGRLVSGLPALAPCTPIACIKLIKTVNPSLAGREALMVGRSHIVGNPLAQLMLREHTTVTIAHTRTRDLPALCRRAEILCVAIGRAQFIRGAWIRPGATVIDIGINRIEADGKFRIVGDVDFAEALQVAGAITPVPGGVGPMTIACLLTNTLRAACMQAGLPEWQV